MDEYGVVSCRGPHHLSNPGMIHQGSIREPENIGSGTCSSVPVNLENVYACRCISLGQWRCCCASEHFLIYTGCLLQWRVHRGSWYLYYGFIVFAMANLVVENSSEPTSIYRYFRLILRAYSCRCSELPATDD